MQTIQEVFRLGMKRIIPTFVDMPPGIHLNLGAGFSEIPGVVPLDMPEWNADLDSIPYKDEAVSGIHAYHFLEHLAQPDAFLYECQRVLCPGGVMQICVPYFRSQIAYQDLDHKHCFTEETWKTLLRNGYYNKFGREWRLDIGANVIIGIVDRNLCLLTQLIRR